MDWHYQQSNYKHKDMMTLLSIMTDYLIPLSFASRAGILALALIADAIIGEPDILWRRLPHPIVMFGRAISATCHILNRRPRHGKFRRFLGILGITALVMLALLIGGGISAIAVSVSHQTMTTWPPFLFEGVAVTILLAGKSLDHHVRAVAIALRDHGLDAARSAVSLIVGRNPASLNKAAICRASIETTAENLSDGVVAPAFYYLAFGLPGIMAYKMINTADSMIGYKSAHWLAFGWGAARLDDLVNLIPARITGLLIVITAILPRPTLALRSCRVMWHDAGKHRSPNAGWPEAAMAGALDIQLAGPRKYGIRVSTDMPLNPDGKQPDDKDILVALRYLWKTTGLMVGILGVIWAVGGNLF
jgi:adenosylcobinamide-phosphate synthase